MDAKKALVVGGGFLVLGVVVVVAFGFGPKKLPVTYVGGDQCATVDDAGIWVSSAPFWKAKKVKWTVEKTDVQWDFVFKGAPPNLLGGPYTIPEEKKSVKSGKSDVEGNWEYKIVVTGDNVSCETDPLIVINKGP